MSSSLDADLPLSFVAEASDLLDEIDPALVAYPRAEDAGDRTDILNRVFRHFHSLKGSAGFLGFGPMARLTHEVENYLDLFRRSPQARMNEAQVNLICQAVDCLRAMLASIAATSQCSEPENTEAIIADIGRNAAVIRNQGFPSAGAALGGAPAPATPAPAAAAGEDGKPAQAKEKGSTHAKRRTVLASEFSARYVSEAHELLDQVEQALLAAEQRPDHNDESVAEALRLLHSFKGNSGFMGLSDLERLGHRMESSIALARQCEASVAIAVFDTMLQMLDILRQGVVEFSKSGKAPVTEIDLYMQLLDGLDNEVRGKMDVAGATLGAPPGMSLGGVPIPAAAGEEPPKGGGRMSTRAPTTQFYLPQNNVSASAPIAPATATPPPVEDPALAALRDSAQSTVRVPALAADPDPDKEPPPRPNKIDLTRPLAPLDGPPLPSMAAASAADAPAPTPAPAVPVVQPAKAANLIIPPSSPPPPPAPTGIGMRGTPSVIHTLGSPSSSVLSPGARPAAAKAATPPSPSKPPSGIRPPVVPRAPVAEPAAPTRRPTLVEPMPRMPSSIIAPQEALAILAGARATPPGPSPTAPSSPGFGQTSAMAPLSTAAATRLTAAEKERTGPVPSIVIPPAPTPEAARRTMTPPTPTGLSDGGGGRAAPHVSSRPADATAGLIRNDIRVDLAKLDAMLDLVGELVIAEAMVTSHPVVKQAENESLERAIYQLRRVATGLQDMAMSVRMIPLATTFRRMIRLVFDLSNKAGKRVDLELIGEDTEVDKTVIEHIADPLVHIIRNAIDHGIEPAEVRQAHGKPPTGKITIEGRHEGGEVWVLVSDDGCGLDRSALLKKGIERGLVNNEGTDWNDTQIYQLIFEPGLSTANKVTDISGRGVGMDVVKKNLEKLNGKIDIRTRPGEGTVMVIRIPLTLAIIDGMLIRSGAQRYIIPLLSIRESLRPEHEQIMQTPDGQELVRIRDDLIPVVRLHEVFNKPSDVQNLEDGILIVVEPGDGEMVALFADELLGQQETVIKGLTGWMKKARGVSGCTIFGDGEVGLILDVGSIARRMRTERETTGRKDESKAGK